MKEQSGVNEMYSVPLLFYIPFSFGLALTKLNKFVFLKSNGY